MDHLPRPRPAADEPIEIVREIIAAVRSNGDQALRDLTRRFDGIDTSNPRVDNSELAAALERIPSDVRVALETALANVWAYHTKQLPNDVSMNRDGITVEGLHRPVARAGCYVPGGRAAYPSTVIMTVVPARVAGVGEVVVTVPPGPDGSVADVTLAAACLAGVSELHAIGGAQAIAALAYGTETIRPVDVIAGPGNRYVAAAQREVAGAVGVPSAFAGPSEVVVVADRSANPSFAAVDLIVQAEHGPDGMSWLITWDEQVADAVTAEVSALVESAFRRHEISQTLASSGYAVICESPEQTCQVVNAIAPEHLELQVSDPDALLVRVDNAGAVFCGPWSPASLGDYLAGPSHVLPTNGTARFAGALTVRDFMKDIHVVRADRSGLARAAPHVIALAEAEGLPAHAESVRLREPHLEAGGLGAAGQPGPGARREIAMMAGYHSPQFDVKVRLNTNESPIGPPPEFVAAMARAMRNLTWQRYPDRSAIELRTRIAAVHDVEPDNVFAANGSNEVLQCLLLAYGGSGRSAAVFEPTYALHSHLIRVTGTTLLEGRRDADFNLDPVAACRLVEQARPELTFLCSPNNPTGQIDSPASIAAVANSVAGAGGLLCIDEAYGQFSPHSALELLTDDTPLVVTQTYSKTWAMAAARLGYAVGPEWLISELEKVALPYHLDAMTQAAGSIALDHAAAMEARVQALITERGRLCDRLGRLAVQVWPSSANFVLFRPRFVDSSTVWHGLLDRSVLIRDFSSWPLLQGCLRVTVGTPAEDDYFLTALEEVLR